MGLSMMLSKNGDCIDLVVHTKGFCFTGSLAQAVSVSMARDKSKVLVMLSPRVKLNLFYQMFLRGMLKWTPYIIK
jgi:hypothetical protein